MDAVELYIPKEYLESFKVIVATGLQKAKIPDEDRKNLSNWWTAERELLNEQTGS